MKELSIEQKAKAYDDIIERLKDFQFEYRFSPFSDVIGDKFPELKESKESEGERIRKALINGFNKLDKSAVWYNGITNGQILAWIEEQGQHKKFSDSIQIGDKVTRNEDGVLVNLSQLKRVAKTEQKLIDKIEPKFKVGDVVENVFTHDQRRVTSIKDDSYITDNVGFIGFYDQDDWELVEQKPAWSEEDEKERKRVVGLLEGWLSTFKETCYAEDCKCGINWLKSLRPQSHWKPSVKQMGALWDSIKHNLHLHPVLKSLYQDLKKLREEDV